MRLLPHKKFVKHCQKRERAFDAGDYKEVKEIDISLGRDMVKYAFRKGKEETALLESTMSSIINGQPPPSPYTRVFCVIVSKMLTAWSKS